MGDCRMKNYGLGKSVGFHTVVLFNWKIGICKERKNFS